MSVVLQPPKRLRKKLYRYDHFHFNTNYSANLPRYQATNIGSAAEQIQKANEEASISISLDALDPTIDVSTYGQTTTGIHVNASPYYVDHNTESNLTHTVANAATTGMTETPVWYANLVYIDGTPNTLAKKILYAPEYVAATGSRNCNDMREPYGLSEYMNFYNKVSTYGKKFRITYTPHYMPGIRGQGVEADSFIAPNQIDEKWKFIREANGQPGMSTNFATSYNGFYHYNPGDVKFLMGCYGAVKPEYAKLIPIWKEGKKLPGPIKSSEEDFKFGIFPRVKSLSRKYTIEYAASIESVYGQKVDMSERYWFKDAAGAWKKSVPLNVTPGS